MTITRKTDTTRRPQRIIMRKTNFTDGVGDASFVLLYSVSSTSNASHLKTRNFLNVALPVDHERSSNAQISGAESQESHALGKKKKEKEKEKPRLHLSRLRYRRFLGDESAFEV
ncbi:hypothetical protein P5V15_003699 [Pogonomyrmex californicus]